MHNLFIRYTFQKLNSLLLQSGYIYKCLLNFINSLDCIFIKTIDLCAFFPLHVTLYILMDLFVTSSYTASSGCAERSRRMQVLLRYFSLPYYFISFSQKRITLSSRLSATFSSEDTSSSVSVIFAAFTASSTWFSFVTPIIGRVPFACDLR